MQTARRTVAAWGRKISMIRRAAFQKLRLDPIFMKYQRNFDWAAGFCPSALSARLI